MKICVISSVYALSEKDRNGSFLVETHRHLKQRGHKISVFAPSYEGLGDHEVEGIPVHRFRYFFKRWEHLTHGQGAPNRIRNPFYLLVAGFYILAGTFSLVRFCLRERFDLLHVHWPFPHAIWGFAAARLSKTPIIINFHGAELLLAKKYGFVKPILRYAIKHAAGVICNSSYTAKQVQALYPRAVQVIPYGTTVTAQATQKDPNKPYKELLFVGRLIARKGLDVLLRALPSLLAKQPIHLHIVGDGNMAQCWRTLSTTLQLDTAVTFHGVVSNEQLQNFYAKADLFVLPAIVDDRGDTEGLGIVLVEALSFATPVVASDVGGISDVILDNQTGLLVPEKSPAALAKAILRLLADDELRSHLARTGLAHANNYFDWARILDLIEASYQASCKVDAPELKHLDEATSKK